MSLHNFRVWTYRAISGLLADGVSQEVIDRFAPKNTHDNGGNIGTSRA
jgi:hypothetical protein